MGIADSVRKMAETAKDTIGADKAKDGIDKAAEKADEVTGARTLLRSTRARKPPRKPSTSWTTTRSESWVPGQISRGEGPGRTSALLLTDILHAAGMAHRAMRTIHAGPVLDRVPEHGEWGPS